MMATGHNTGLIPKLFCFSFLHASCLFPLSPEWGPCWHPQLQCLSSSVIRLNLLNSGTDAINSQGSRLLISCLKVAIVDSSVPMDLTQRKICHLLNQHHLLGLGVSVPYFRDTYFFIWKLTQPTQTNLKKDCCWRGKAASHTNWMVRLEIDSWPWHGIDPVTGAGTTGSWLVPFLKENW